MNSIRHSGSNSSDDSSSSSASSLSRNSSDEEDASAFNSFSSSLSSQGRESSDGDDTDIEEMNILPTQTATRRTMKVKNFSFAIPSNTFPFRRRKIPASRNDPIGGSSGKAPSSSSRGAAHPSRRQQVRVGNSKGFMLSCCDGVFDLLADFGSLFIADRSNRRSQTGRKHPPAWGDVRWKGRCSWYLLICSIIIWGLVHLMPQLSTLNTSGSYSAANTSQRPKINGNPKRIPSGTHRRRNGTTSAENLPQGCTYHEWQERNRLNCNNLHEIDLREHIRFGSKSNQAYNSSISGQPPQARLQDAYLASGLWRDVFSIRWKSKSLHANPMAVLKMMRLEHEVDSRNLERHRRDALAMEHTTSNPHVIDAYGYCGNSVLTEQAEMGLDKYIKANRITWKILDRLKAALQAAEGILALHEVDIIHADLQTKQFLVNRLGVIKVNDFNRCRFLPRKIRSSTPASTIMNTTTSTAIETNLTPVCPIQIPSAPGTFRSPEEYTRGKLTHAMDIYSFGNVLYEVLSGERVRNSKQEIENGEKPKIPNIEEQSLQGSLARLIDRCFEFDPEKRITAKDLVEEMKFLVSEANKT